MKNVGFERAASPVPARPDGASPLASYVAALEFDEIPRAVVEKVKRHILDLLGVALLGGRADSSPLIRSAIQSFARMGNVSVWGQSLTLAPAHAALLNAVHAHSLDFDDTHLEGSVHPGCTVVPTALAVGEQQRVDGKQLIVAVLVGYDVTCRIARALGPRSHYERGFHPTATTGVFGATAAAASILGLSVPQLINAFGINASQAAGSMQFLSNGAWNKRLHPGFACQNAVFAVELARRGFIAASSPLEGRFGFFHAYSGAARPEQMLSGLGEEFEIMRTEIKPYPACRYAHDPIASIVELAERHDLQPHDIESITVRLPQTAVELIGKPEERKREPKNPVDGQFSMHFLAAAAVMRRRMTWQDYELLEDPTARQLMGRIRVVADTEADRAFPREWLSSVEIVSRAEKFESRRRSVPADDALGMSSDDATRKFLRAAQETVGKEQGMRLIGLVEQLEVLTDITILGTALRRRELK